jgi:hypothetical protein
MTQQLRDPGFAGATEPLLTAAWYAILFRRFCRRAA